MTTPGAALFGTRKVLGDVAAERRRQDAKFPDQTLPDGTDPIYTYVADYVRQRTDQRAENGTLTWRDVLDEEVAEVFAETDVQKLRDELVQVAAVATRWIEDIDRRTT